MSEQTLSARLSTHSQKDSLQDTMQLHSFDKVKLAGGTERNIIVEDRKNTYNENNGVYNIYDEKGALWVTSNPRFVESLTKDFNDLKQDKNMGVELSNGTELSGSKNYEWTAVRDRGVALSERFWEEKREKIDKIAALRGTAQTAPAPIKKTEMNREFSAQMLKQGAER